MEVTQEASNSKDESEKPSEDPVEEDDGNEEYVDIAEEEEGLPAWTPKPSTKRRCQQRPRKLIQSDHKTKLKMVVRSSFKTKKKTNVLKRDKNVMLYQVLSKARPKSFELSQFLQRAMKRRERVAEILQNRKNLQEVEVKLWNLDL